MVYHIPEILTIIKMVDDTDINGWKKKKEQNSESLRFPSFLSISTSSLLLVFSNCMYYSLVPRLSCGAHALEPGNEAICISDPVNVQIQNL